MPQTSQSYFQHEKDIIMTQTFLKYGSLSRLYLINSTNKNIMKKNAMTIKKILQKN
jgi:hypothetical protein